MADAEPTIAVLPPLNSGHDDFGTSSSDDDDDEYDEAEALRTCRLKQGKCPQCGQELYKLVRRGVLRKKLTFLPLTVEGLVVRGQCLKCLDGDEALAIALSSMPEGFVALQEPPTDAATSSNIEGFEPIITIPIATYVSTDAAVQQVDVTYTGGFNNHGERHGNGVLIWSNGDKYVGTFWNGLREGEGTIQFADGSEYVGNWENNKMHGQGTRRFNNGNVFNGTYREGKRSGHGRCYFANGDMYVGEWKSDAMSGFGRYYYNDGQSFEGSFLEGKRHGKGKYQLTDGRVDIYRYINDIRVGEGVRWSTNRRKAWRLVDGKPKGKISLQIASQIMLHIGEGQPELPGV